MFVYFERERDQVSKWVEGQRERRERIRRSLCAISLELNERLHLMNHEIMTWAKTKSLMLTWLSHLGAPLKNLKASTKHSLGLAIIYVKKLKWDNLLAYFKCNPNDLFMCFQYLQDEWIWYWLLRDSRIWDVEDGKYLGEESNIKEWRKKIIISNSKIIGD